MIVDPDFLDHWRTQMLVDMLNDPCAPQYIIRLWGHCQNRRSWVFEGMPVQAAKAICRFPGQADEFEKAMIDCGFLARDGDTLTVVGWDEHNASLIANWTNGSRGGRPKGSGKETRKKLTGKPDKNPSANLQETDKIGCDEIGSDKPPKSPKGDAVPYQEIVDLYHEHLPMLPRVVNISDKRKRAMRARWAESVNIPTSNDVISMKCDSLDFWARYFKRAATQPFLIGEKTDWAADFDFLLTKSKFIAVIEQKYLRD